MGRNYYSIEHTNTETLNARLLSISLSKDERDWQGGLHTHPFTEIFYVMDGKGSFLFPEKSYSIKPGDLIIIPAYLEHTEQSFLVTVNIMSLESMASPFQLVKQTNTHIFFVISVPYHSLLLSSNRFCMKGNIRHMVLMPSARNFWRFYF